MPSGSEHDGGSAGAEPEVRVRDNEAKRRFEATVDGGEPATAAYRLEGDVITFTHTEVPPALGGRGVGSALVRAALDSARQRGLTVLPLCSFVARYMRGHPETQDLLPPSYRPVIEG